MFQKHIKMFKNEYIILHNILFINERFVRKRKLNNKNGF